MYSKHDNAFLCVNLFSGGKKHNILTVSSVELDLKTFARSLTKNSYLKIYLTPYLYEPHKITNQHSWVKVVFELWSKKSVW